MTKFMVLRDSDFQKKNKINTLKYIPVSCTVLNILDSNFKYENEKTFSCNLQESAAN